MLRTKPSRVYFREWRDYRDLDQERASERMDMTQGNLSRIENGEIGYTQRTLEAMAFAYRCEVPDLFRHPNARPAEVVEFVASLPEDKQARALAVLKTIFADAA